jgi:hypothetical protein
VAGCEHTENEDSGSINCGYFLDYLNDYQLLTLLISKSTPCGAHGILKAVVEIFPDYMDGTVQFMTLFTAACQLSPS